MDNRLIGIFDSGVGGLTVAFEIYKQLNTESFLYFGDTARNPYGTRPMTEVSDFSRQIATFLESNGAKVVVIACNTATIASIELLESTFGIPVIGVVDSSVNFAADITKNGVIGILATDGTVKSGVFEKKLKSINPDFKVVSTGCPKLVQMAEECIFEGEEAEKTVAGYLEELKKAGVDTIILGCTHFPLFEKIISSQMGMGVNIVNPASKVTEILKNLLNDSDAFADSKEPKHMFCTNSEDNSNFEKVCSHIFNEPCKITYVATEDLLNAKKVFNSK